jgi:hypothetical protein
MHFIKFTTSDAETRWINLEQVCRFTLATDTARNYPVLAIVFADGSLEEKLVINGSNDQNRKVIEQIAAHLDGVTQANCGCE